tara:strand:+ start:538 stop:756 length:219 start_codon:yes stop_codon:yes gene_type:complete
VNCKVYADKNKDFTKHNVGDSITITGIFYCAEFDINQGMNGLWTFQFNGCRNPVSQYEIPEIVCGGKGCQSK